MASDPNEPAGQTPTTLFLSYARADRARAEKLADVLTRAGYTVWWDALIEGGAQYATSIRQALETADVVIVLWSRNSVEFRLGPRRSCTGPRPAPVGSPGT